MKRFLSVLMFFTFLGAGMYAQNSSVEEIIKENGKTMTTAMANGDAEGFGMYFAEDAMLHLSGNAPLEGRMAIIEAHRPMAEQGMKLMIDVEDVFVGGDYATEYGSYEIHSPDGQKVDHGYYSTLWKKSGDEWKIIRDVVSSSVAPSQHK
ncbi:YybH family protein [Salegentibacter chungangensis]|uniref:YybH family protein n=1 Tax=Salegentibacter chungangensis TaxID=1335724 RepID=A0ABW3NRA6_9FLAO